MTVVEHIATATDLERLSGDGFRCELVRGEVRKMVPAGNEHGQIAALVTVSLGQHVLANRLGAVYAAETGFRLASDPDTVRAPDAAFVCQARLDAVGVVAGYWPGAPGFGGGGGLAGRPLRGGRGKGRRLAGGRDADGGPWLSRSSGRWRCIGLRVLWMYCEKAMCWRAGR